MPRNDKTGPMGQGPGTGRGMGVCAGNTPRGRGCRNGGLGRGRFASPANDLAALEKAEKMHEEELVAIRKRKADLKA